MTDPIHLVLAYRCLDEPASALAEALYGIAYDEVIRPVRAGRFAPPSYKVTRYPHAAALASFIEDALSGLYAHDGRSRNRERLDGWWRRDLDTGDWHPTSIDAIAATVSRSFGTILAEAKKRRDTEAARLPKRNADEYEAALPAYEEAELRYRIISSATSALASVSRSATSALVLLRERLTLTPADIESIAAAWLTDHLDELPIHGNRISVSAVKDLHAAEDASLPVQTLYRGLDAVLGPRLRRVEWSLVNLAAEATPEAEPVQRGEHPSHDEEPAA